MTVLASSLAGAWYAGDPAALREQVRGFLEAEPAQGVDDLCALLVPHAGFDYSGATAGKAYREAREKAFARVIVIGPSHRIPLRDKVLVPRAEGFQTPLGTLAADTEATEQMLREEGFQAADPDDFMTEHSVQIQFPFLQMALPGIPVAPLIVGRLSDAATDRLAEGIRAVLTSGTLLVISSDFTHFGPSFGYVPFRSNIPEQLHRLDLDAFAAIRDRDRAAFRAYLRRTGATICGADPIALLLTLLSADQHVRLLSYTTSGHETGDWGHTVSYLAAAVSGAWNEPAREE